MYLRSPDRPVRRLYGLEMEWGHSVQLTGAPKSQPFEAPSGETISSLLASYTRTIDRSEAAVKAYIKHGTLLHLGNAALFYVDHGHLEGSTSEATTIKEAVTNDLANERIALDIFNNGVRRGIISRFVLNKRVANELGESWGGHENYLSLRDRLRFPFETQQLEVLGLHLATRGIFTGAGMLKQNGKFMLAQKASGVRLDYATHTTGTHKPLVNLRYEPLASPEYQRLHVVSGDTPLSPWATTMQLGTTSLVLRLIEHGLYPELPRNLLDGELTRLARHTAGDLSLKKSITLESSDGAAYRINALQVQEALAKACFTLAEHVDIPQDELEVLAWWIEAIEDAKVDPMNLADRADWPDKYQILERARRRKGLSPSDKLLRAYDRNWDDMTHGIAVKQRRDQWAQWMPSEAEVIARINQAPVDNRAAIRGKFVTAFSGRDDVSVSWQLVRYKTQGERKHKVVKIEPFDTESDEVDELIAAA